jgi:hypothetical protein
MRRHNSLLAGAGLSLTLALSLGAAAQAKTVKHHHAAAVAAPDPREEEIRELREQNQMLNARLSAVEGMLQQTQAKADAATQAAQSSVSQAQSVQAQADAEIKRIPDQVKTAVAAIPKPKPGWEAATSISGRMYYDITNISQKSNGVTPAGVPNGTNFDIKRFYVSIDHKFNDVFSADITTDFNYDSGPAGATQLYIKKAYLQAKLSDAMVVKLGSADLPWVPFVEDIYGYRYVENVMIDRTKFGTSADWGVHLTGKLPAGAMTINYAFSAINGMGYKKPGFIGGVNRSKGIDVEGRVSANVGDFTAAVGGYTGKLGNDVEGVATFNNAERFDALLAYVNKRVRIGGEYFYAKDWNDVKQSNPLLTNSSEGFSAFGSFKFTDRVALFGRYDWVKPKRDTAPTLKNDYFNVGVSYSPARIVDFALMYKREKVANGTLATQNGTIGGSVDGTYDEVGLWSQFRW